jgi:hypothetical protein
VVFDVHLSKHLVVGVRLNFLHIVNLPHHFGLLSCCVNEHWLLLRRFVDVVCVFLLRQEVHKLVNIWLDNGLVVAVVVHLVAEPVKNFQFVAFFDAIKGSGSQANDLAFRVVCGLLESKWVSEHEMI